MITFIAFWGLFGFTLAQPQLRQTLSRKDQASWILDMSGLVVQGMLIPLLQIAVVYQGYRWLLPGLHHAWALSPLGAFLLSFVGVDYLYYWNHRLLHSHWLWPIHRVHHTVTQMDVLGTSRNTLWSSFFILYLWVHALFIFSLSDPTAYILGVSLSNALDLWRHSEAHPPAWLSRWLAPWLILPQDHAWHHSPESGTNYGANLKLWDWLHNTAHQPSCDRPAPASLGIPTPLSLVQQLIWPF